MTGIRQVRAFLLRAATLLRRDRMERDVAAEIDSHLELHIEDNLRAGMAPGEARRQAVLALGGVAQARERYRDRRGLPAVEAFLQDVRFGARLLRKHKAFTTVAVATLAIGVGPMMAAFAIGNWALLRTLPGVRDPESVGQFMVGRPSPRGGTTIARVSYLNYLDIAPRFLTLTLAGFQDSDGLRVAGGGIARETGAQYVTPSFFEVLGVRFQAGRPFSPAEDRPGNPALVAVISDRLWSSFFDRDPSVLGRTIDINGHTLTVVGVTERGFHGTDRIPRFDVWLPGTSEPVIRYMDRRGSRSDDRARGGYYEFVARLAPGATWPQAEAELGSMIAWMSSSYPEANAKFTVNRFSFSGLVGTINLDDQRQMFAMVMGAMAIVLLITCSNVACLLLIRGVARRDEIAARRALGASRWRLLQQHLTEGLLLWLLGGTAGALLAGALTYAVSSRALPAIGAFDTFIPYDWRVLAFTAALPLAVGLLFSVVPATRATRVDVTETLKGAGGPVATRASFSTGSALTVFQLSASLTLIVGALLLAATLRHLTRLDLGFDVENVTVAGVNPSTIGYDDGRSLVFYRELVARLRARPGIQLVAMADQTPLFNANFRASVRRAGDPVDASRDTWSSHVVSSDYFQALGIPLVRGRTFTEDEIPAPFGRGTRLAVVLGESLARQLFGTTDVVGRAIEVRGIGREGLHEVVGVAGDIRFRTLTDDRVPVLYDPSGPGPLAMGRTTIVVRSGPEVDGAAELRNALAALDAKVPSVIRPVSEIVRRERIEWDVLAWLMIALAVVASLLAAVGVYGLVAFNAASRRAEFGIRMALGAGREVVQRLVFRRAVRLGAAGLLFGLGGSYAMTQVLRGQLVGVEPLDPVVWITAALVLVAVVIGASLTPARHAARASLADTLRAM